ncbi:MAG: adenylate/guanylate cyclase domain-containing protein [Planctomycetes bacterium]|nr:adenylate/guanylate cyclase domain-containing protein [Planctomycetota bacterium]
MKYALQQSDPGQAFVARFGNREVDAFVGFVDLVGFTDRTKGRAPREMSDYLRPFLEGVVSAVIEMQGLVDKTIGDEVMFVLPELLEDGGGAVTLRIGSLLAGLQSLQSRLGPQYRMRVGLARGTVFVDSIQGQGYLEWTVVGETVNLAKRLHSLPALVKPATITCAVAALEHEVESVRHLKGCQSDILNRIWRATEIPEQDLHALKGVSASWGFCCMPAAPAEA